MPKRKGKPVSFDAMVKFFMQHYNIPTKKDIDKLMSRMDLLEDLIKKAAVSGKRSRSSRVAAAKDTGLKKRTTATASDKVLDVIKRFKQGASFADIQNRTGYDDKKLRNIIFRLNKTGRIKRKLRGIYIAA